MKLSKIVGILLIGIACIIGPTLLFFGIKGEIERKNQAETYVETEGYFIDYTVHERTVKRKRRTTYQLHYEYIVDGTSYRVSTDYTTGSIPAEGSVENILYNPANPEEAIIRGASGVSVMLVVGGMFTVVPVLMILIFLQMKGIIGGGRIDWMDIILGIVIGAIGLGVFYVGAGTFSLTKLIQKMSIFGIIPILFIVVGVLLIVRGFRGGMKER